MMPSVVYSRYSLRDRLKWLSRRVWNRAGAKGLEVSRVGSGTFSRGQELVGHIPEIQQAEGPGRSRGLLLGAAGRGHDQGYAQFPGIQAIAMHPSQAKVLGGVVKALPMIRGQHPEGTLDSPDPWRAGSRGEPRL